MFVFSLFNSFSFQAKIEKLVTAMGGVYHSKASSDVSFVLIKNVLAAKYKVSYFKCLFFFSKVYTVNIQY